METIEGWKTEIIAKKEVRSVVQTTRIQMETVAETNRGKYRTYNFKVQACSSASLRSPSKGPINIELLHPQSIARIILDFVPSIHHLYIQQRHASLARTLKPPKERRDCGRALLPHEIIESLNETDGGEVANVQWKRMVDDLSKKRKMKNCLAICYVSGSMSGVPMEVSVATGVLVSKLSGAVEREAYYIQS
ncbi:hypothetical protein RHSIM_Rhsim12G0019800 [Rhododendron simsii]|uniref:Uncharacterized protein n=1 Tax=Rhododendron simsii TaxID=118357 RepID=A0A834G598_RHOSS|nr:hypothetical protein RHSIM_Rhsim12G0019800 [Rhododendron simsii]